MTRHCTSVEDGRTAGSAPSRRCVIAGLASGLLAAPARAGEPPIRAIAFDGFPVFDPRSVAALARSLFPTKGEALASAWASKLFAYTWLETAADQYRDFEALADASLQFAAQSLQLDLPQPTRSRLVAAYSQLDAWPDVKPALAKLRGAGLRLGFLSNLTESMLQANMRHADVSDAFEVALSTDRVRKFKPAPAAYHMAVEAFGLDKAEIGFAAFGGWDAVGATWFGYRTAWINRAGAPAERLGVQPAIVTRGIDGVLALAGLA